MKIAVVGAGWAGLAAAVRATQLQHQVSLYEMAAVPGGRARSVLHQDRVGDNGQHILIGAYLRTLDLMKTVGVVPGEVLHRQALVLRYPDGRGLALPEGGAWWTLAVAVGRCRGWTWSDRWSLVREAMGWARGGFVCSSDTTVAILCQRLTPAVRSLLIDPLCVAALNTPAQEASARVFLRVLRDTLLGGQRSTDLMLPKRPLGELLPAAAITWLAARGTNLHLGQRVQDLRNEGRGWQVDGQAFDAVILACSAAEAARLVGGWAPDWARGAAALAYEPIITVYLDCPGARLPSTMTALCEDDASPAQFAFDHGALGGPPGQFAFVVSGARKWVDRGLEATTKAVLAQALGSMPAGTWPQPPVLSRVVAEKRATFRCTPALDRPPMEIAPGLLAAGDYVAGPYPATLEGAVRSGESAVAALNDAAEQKA